MSEPNPTPRRPINPPPLRLPARVFRRLDSGYGVRIPMGNGRERELGPFPTKESADEALSAYLPETKTPLFDNQ
jgi:hypothetical protein